LAPRLGHTHSGAREAAHGMEGVRWPRSTVGIGRQDPLSGVREVGLTGIDPREKRPSVDARTRMQILDQAGMLTLSYR